MLQNGKKKRHKYGSREKAAMLLSMLDKRLRHGDRHEQMWEALYYTGHFFLSVYLRSETSRALGHGYGKQHGQYADVFRRANDDGDTHTSSRSMSKAWRKSVKDEDYEQVNYVRYLRAKLAKRDSKIKSLEEGMEKQEAIHASLMAENAKLEEEKMDALMNGGGGDNSDGDYYRNSNGTNNDEVRGLTAKLGKAYRTITQVNIDLRTHINRAKIGGLFDFAIEELTAELDPLKQLEQYVRMITNDYSVLRTSIETQESEIRNLRKSVANRLRLSGELTAVEAVEQYAKSQEYSRQQSEAFLRRLGSILFTGTSRLPINSLTGPIYTESQIINEVVLLKRKVTNKDEEIEDLMRRLGEVKKAYMRKKADFTYRWASYLSQSRRRPLSPLPNPMLHYLTERRSIGKSMESL